MSHTRARSTTASAGDPHAISLKVLRLSRPSLATQTPLPHTNFGDGTDIAPNASLAYPSAGAVGVESSFPLTPLLTLPPAFGAAYVGEVFACTLCVNNELGDAQHLEDQSVGGAEGRRVESVDVKAELRTPSLLDGMEMQLEGAEGESGALQPGRTMQKIVRHELKEEGVHVLAVTTTYTERIGGDEGQERTRTFRKLYQFVAQQLIAVRSKVSVMKRRRQMEGKRWIIEAQLENVGEASVVLEKVALNEADGFVGKEVDAGSGEDGGGRERTVLKPADVEQVMFIVEEKEDGSGEDGQAVKLAQLVLSWRGAMGEKGGLTTGWLASRGR
ncbi:hypothetical protein K431DRAFT_295964 [Polychaeton citri CBS 116435]|uniref:Uncharacterized protein n=1 Tax=Polychaeton citri CBS 116435 TaxID=1314669 RepID=A0A9P4Q568_9PEZI|nr:hypothetical protein K431DRAFT_295964 [Polychaeton citri CBS 116435]